jgi:hypothetical protein
VLDSTPGKLFAAGGGEDHPGELIASLRQMPEVVRYRYTNSEYNDDDLVHLHNGKKTGELWQILELSEIDIL